MSFSVLSTGNFNEVPKADSRENSVTKKTELHTFLKKCYYVDLDRLDTLLSQNDVNGKDQCGWMPLHYILNNLRHLDTHWDVVIRLLQAGADPFAITDNGDEPKDILIKYAANFGSHVSGDWINTFEKYVKTYSTIEPEKKDVSELKAQIKLVETKISSLLLELSFDLNLPQLPYTGNKEDFNAMHNFGCSLLNMRNAQRSELRSKMDLIYKLWLSSDLKSFSDCFSSSTLQQLENYFKSDQAILSRLKFSKSDAKT